MNVQEENSIAAPYGNTFRDKITGMEFVWVPGGSFEMGDFTKDDGWEEIWMSIPVHRVTLKGFYLGKYAVTQEEWQKIIEGNPASFRDRESIPSDPAWLHNPSEFKKGGKYPVEGISWFDVKDFLCLLNKKSGRNYRLPSEAQWEYAARECGKKVLFATGKNSISTAEANYNDSESGMGGRLVEACEEKYRKRTVPVDSFSPNALGLYNMSGNVSEWCQDVWHDNYEGAPDNGSAWETDGDPYHDGEGGVYKDDRRVVRGGSWFDEAYGEDDGLRTTNRFWRWAEDRDSDVGFRLLLPV